MSSKHLVEHPCKAGQRTKMHRGQCSQPPSFSSRRIPADQPKRLCRFQACVALQGQHHPKHLRPCFARPAVRFTGATLPEDVSVMRKSAGQNLSKAPRHPLCSPIGQSRRKAALSAFEFEQGGELMAMGALSIDPIEPVNPVSDRPSHCNRDQTQDQGCQRTRLGLTPLPTATLGNLFTSHNRAIAS